MRGFPMTLLETDELNNCGAGADTENQSEADEVGKFESQHSPIQAGWSQGEVGLKPSLSPDLVWSDPTESQPS